MGTAFVALLPRIFESKGDRPRPKMMTEYYTLVTYWAFYSETLERSNHTGQARERSGHQLSSLLKTSTNRYVQTYGGLSNSDGRSSAHRPALESKVFPTDKDEGDDVQ